eukprot:5521876-Prymnesium_polylepis.2
MVLMCARWPLPVVGVGSRGVPCATSVHAVCGRGCVELGVWRSEVTGVDILPPPAGLAHGSPGPTRVAVDLAPLAIKMYAKMCNPFIYVRGGSSRGPHRRLMTRSRLVTPWDPL